MPHPLRSTACMMSIVMRNHKKHKIANMYRVSLEGKDTVAQQCETSRPGAALTPKKHELISEQRIFRRQKSRHLGVEINFSTVRGRKLSTI